MTGRRRAAVGGATLLALLVAGWLLREGDAPTAPGTGADPTEIRRPEVRLRGAAAETDARGAGGPQADPEVRSERSWPVAVLDAAGRPLAGARVLVQRPSFSMFGGGRVTEAEARTDGRGIARLPRRGRTLTLPAPGAAPPRGAVRYHVEVRPPADRPDLAPLEGAAWPPETEALSLPAGGQVGGVVEDPRGRGLADVVVRVVGRPTARRRTDADGVFRIPHLPFGEHVLRLEVPGLPALGARRWTVATGDLNLHVVVEAGASLRVLVSDGVAAADGRRLRIARVGDAPREIDVEAGRVTVHGLEPRATYTLHLPAGFAGRVGWASHVSGAAASLHLPMREEVVLEGRVEVPPGTPWHAVRVEARRDGMVFPGGVRRGAGGTCRWKVVDLPEADVEVVGWTGEATQPNARGRLLATADGENDLRLVPVR